LRFQQDGKGRIATDVDPFDWIHLDGYFQAFGHVLAGK
jgi:hypothetical protein